MRILPAGVTVMAFHLPLWVFCTNVMYEVGVRYGQVPAETVQGNPRGPKVGPDAVFTEFCAVGPGGRNCDFKLVNDGPEANVMGATPKPNTIIGSPAA